MDTEQFLTEIEQRWSIDRPTACILAIEFRDKHGLTEAETFSRILAGDPEWDALVREDKLMEKIMINGKNWLKEEIKKELAKRRTEI